MRRMVLVPGAALALAMVLTTPAARAPAADQDTQQLAGRSATRPSVPAPDLSKCGQWQDEACKPILDAYGGRVASRLMAARGTAARLPASANEAAVTQACPRGAFPGAVCGHVDVPLDRGAPQAGTIAIAFELYLHSDPGPATSAILVNWGGPGGGTIVGRGSAFFLFWPLLAEHDLLLIDDRGRGFSGVLYCPELQYAVGTIAEQVQACADILGADSDRYGTGDIAMDTDAVREALGYELVDYYGVSYGGADINAYATRFPEHIRSLVLDSPWGDTLARQEESIHASSYVTSTLDVIQIICERSASCSAERGDPVGDFGSLVEHVRLDPVTGRATSWDGRRIRVTVDPKSVIEYLMYPWYFFTNLSEIASAAAALERDDPAPILRLAAEGFYPIEGAPMPDPLPPPPRQFSYGSFVATFCPDTEWEWDWSAPIADRETQHGSEIAAAPAELFLPFTGAEATDSTFIGTPYCILWPDPTGSSPIAPPNAVYPDVPTLVIGGDLDNVVPLQITEWTADLFPDSQLVEFAGAGHGAAFWSSCALELVRGFVATLEIGDTSCADTPEFAIPSVGEFPLVAAEASPAHPWPGGDNQARVAERRVAAVAAAAVKDAIARANLAFIGPGKVESRGLRGGRVFFEFKGKNGFNVLIHLENVRFAEDVRIDGIVHWPPDPTIVRAELSVSGPGTVGGDLSFRTTKYLIAKYFRVTGELGGRRVDVRVPQA